MANAINEINAGSAPVETGSADLSARLWSAMQSDLANDRSDHVDGVNAAQLGDGTYVGLSDFNLGGFELYEKHDSPVSASSNRASTDQTGAAKGDVCQPEIIQEKIIVGGQETVVSKITEYGKWLKEEAAKALNVEPPQKAPPLNDVQQKLFDQAGTEAAEFASKLLKMSQGKPDITMRDNLQELQRLFNQRHVTPEESKAVCDAINVQLKEQGYDWLRIAVSDTTGEIYLGIKSQHDGKFTTAYEIRNKAGCPEQPQ